MKAYNNKTIGSFRLAIGSTIGLYDLKQVRTANVSAMLIYMVNYINIHALIADTNSIVHGMKNPGWGPSYGELQHHILDCNTN